MQNKKKSPARINIDDVQKLAQLSSDGLQAMRSAVGRKKKAAQARRRKRLAYAVGVSGVAGFVVAKVRKLKKR